LRCRSFDDLQCFLSTPLTSKIRQVVCSINYFVFENKIISKHHEKNYFAKIIYYYTSRLSGIFSNISISAGALNGDIERRGGIRGLYSCMLML